MDILEILTTTVDTRVSQRRWVASLRRRIILLERKKAKEGQRGVLRVRDTGPFFVFCRGIYASVDRRHSQVLFTSVRIADDDEIC